MPPRTIRRRSIVDLGEDKPREPIRTRSSHTDAPAECICDHVITIHSSPSKLVDVAAFLWIFVICAFIAIYVYPGFPVVATIISEIIGHGR